MIGRSAAMQELFDSIRRLAPHVRTVLVTGETGTGKELVARALHKVGPRRDRPFVTVNCSAVVETLFESELFGHQRGAFTGATETKIGVFEHADERHAVSRRGRRAAAERPAQAAARGRVRRGPARRLAGDAGTSTSTSSPRRTAICAPRPAPGDSAATCSTGSSIMEIHVAPLRERRERHPALDGRVHPRVRAAAEPPPHRHHDRRRTHPGGVGVGGQCPRAAQRGRARVSLERIENARRSRHSRGHENVQALRPPGVGPCAQDGRQRRRGRRTAVDGPARADRSRLEAGGREQNASRASARDQPEVPLSLDRSAGTERNPRRSARVVCQVRTQFVRRCHIGHTTRVWPQR